MRILSRPVDPSTPPRMADRMPGPGRALVALVVAGYRFGRRVVPPLAAALAAGSVLAWRWHSGAVMRPTWRGRPRWARQVRAAGRCALTGVGAAALVDWRLTLLCLALLAAGTAAAALAVRESRRPRPARSTLPPRRVRVMVGTPTRGGVR